MEGAVRRRLARLFRTNGRAVIVALDHGFFTTGFIDPKTIEQTLSAIAAGGCDAVLVTPGIVRHLGSTLERTGLIVRLDSATRITQWSMEETKRRFSVSDAVRLGADAVVVMVLTHCSQEAVMLDMLAQTVSEASTLSIPVMVEALPVSYQPTSDNISSRLIAESCHLAFEYGADVVKTRPSSDGQFHHVVAQTGLPIVVLGGARTTDDLHLLQTIEECMQAGACGVAIGRNIWQHPYPETITRAIVAVVHEGLSAEVAVQYLEGRASSQAQSRTTWRKTKGTHERRQ